jgi:hypothetical protein
MQLTITEDHLLLLENMYIDWNSDEYGAPAVDSKRPYGNSSVIHDIGEILGKPPDEEDDYSDELRSELNTIHEETQFVLQILVQHARVGIRIGATYELIGKEWECVS